MKNHIITRDELNTHLWGAADILRGSVDASEFKNHIFGLLFLKRMSDVFDEEFQAVIARETKNGVSAAEARRRAEDPDEHVFYVPEDARWSTLMAVGENRAEKLDVACRELEASNPGKLEGVLGSIVFNDPHRFGDAKDMDGLMQRLLTHFNKWPLGNRNLSEPDILGNAYEYLIERFAEDAGKKGGEFYTPRMVVRLIVELLRPQEAMRIHDPTVGSGGMLIEAAHFVQDHGKDPRNLTLSGQEKNRGTWAICKMNMLLHNLPDADIRPGDTIRSPKFTSGGRLMTFDRVLANPPFSLKDWGHDHVEKDDAKKYPGDPWGRFADFAVPPRTKGDLAFVLHMLNVTNERGMVGVVVPHGVLFRGSKEGEIRSKLLEQDRVEAVIGLPAGLFFGTGIPAAVLVLNKAKPEERRGKVLFIDASPEGLYQEGSNRNYLRHQDVLRAAAVFHGYAQPDAVRDTLDQLETEHLAAGERDRDRQLQRVGHEDEDARSRILAEADQRLHAVTEAAGAVRAWLDQDEALARYAAIVPVTTIATEHDHNLNISRYVDSSPPAETLDVAAELKKLRELEQARDAAEAEMKRLLKELGYDA